jgi:DNA recombination protein RmuC
MDLGPIVVATLTLFTGGAVGFWLARLGRAAAVLEARRSATQELAVAQQELRSADGRGRALAEAVAQHEARAAREREQLLAVSSSLARAAAVADQVPGLAERAEALQREVTALAEERARLGADLEAERRAAAERAALAERSREQVRTELHALASQLVDEKGKAMLHQSREGLEALLSPVAARLREFEAKVEKTYDVENRDRASLLASLQRLQETQARLHQDAESLARALTGESKTQGDWGELVLERVLETAGLTEGREYDLQVSHPDGQGGQQRPDALVYLPGDRVVVVDAKCSLTAFVEATRAATAEARELALDAHVDSLRSHVRGLAAKRYPELFTGRTVDLVLLFVPSEAAFHAAVARDAGLYDEAFRQRVVLCSPTTLFAALQLISHLWRSEKQNVNAQRIGEEAGRLLDKLKAFLVDLDEVGSRVEQAQASFQSARSKLLTGRGNVMKKAADLVRLGARAKPETGARLLFEAATAEDGADATAAGEGGDLSDEAALDEQGSAVS